jgi:subtilisin family serine protease
VGLTTGDTNAPSTTTGTMIDAISYILNTAKHTINKPVVINLSLGTYTEKMDGSSNECQTMNSLLTNAANDEGFAIVFAAGNEADSNFHAKATVPAGPAATLGIRFKILPGDSKDRYIAIVYSGSNLRVRVTFTCQWCSRCCGMGGIGCICDQQYR